MNKKLLLVLTVAGALAAPAVRADTSNVQIYGWIFPQFVDIRSSGATPVGTPASSLSSLVQPVTGTELATRNRIDSNFSYIGFKGTEDLGGGLKAIWQIQSGIPIDAGGGVWADQNSQAGLSGKFGTVFYGNWYPPYRIVGAPVSFLGISARNIVSPTKILTTAGLKNATAASFHRQQNNIVEYWSPTFSGVSLKYGYSPDETKTAVKNASLHSASIDYRAGPVYLALGHEIHNDFFGGSATSGKAAGTSSRDTGTRVSVGLTFGDTQVGVDVERLKYNEAGAAAGGFGSYTRDAIGIVAQQKFGKVQVALGLAQANDGTCSLAGGAACSTTGLGALQSSIGASYSFSKSTLVYAFYTHISAKPSSTYNLAFSPGVVGSPGSDQTGVAVGLSQRF